MVESPGADGRSTGDGRGESASAQELADVGSSGGRVAHTTYFVQSESENESESPLQ